MILNENLFENKPVKFPKTDYYIRVKEGVELVNGKVKEFEDGVKIGIHETPYGKVASDVRTGYKIIDTQSPLVQGGDKYIYGSKNDEELFNQAYDLLKSIDQDYYNSIPNAVNYVENLTEAKGSIGTQKGEKRGPYKKVDTESKYEKVTSAIDKQVEWVAKENGKKVLKKLTAYPNMKVKNEFYFNAPTPSLLEKGKAVLDKFNIDYKEEDGKVSWVFKNEDFDEINLDKVSYKTKELFRESIGKELTFHKFVDYLESIGNSYHTFNRVSRTDDSKKYSGYRYTLSNPLTDEQVAELSQYSNVEFGKAQYKFAPEINYSTVILIDKITPIKNISTKQKMGLEEDILTSKAPNSSEMSFDVKADGTIIIYDGDKIVKQSKTNPEYAKKVLKDLGFKEKEIIKEDINNLEKEFTIHYNKVGFEYGGYGAVRVKASDEKEAKKKFLDKKTDKDIEITSVRPTENEDIRKGIRLLEDTEIVKESFEDEHLGSTEKVIEDGGEIIPDSVDPGPDAGIASQLNKLIIDEWEAIQGYNDAIVMAELEGFHDVAKVLKDIVNEENLHVGQLEQCMKLVSPNADSISHGEIEAEEQLGEEPAPIEKEEDPEEGMHY